MLYQNAIWMGNTAAGEHISILPKLANRHGLIAGATGTGKTVTIKVMAEAFSELGVPVFMADVKGDIASMMNPGADSADMQERIARFGLAEAGFSFCGYPVTLWDIYGKSGVPLRTTISEMGPVLLARILDLNDLQTSILAIIFKIADDNDLLLVDTKDLKAIVAWVDEHRSDLTAEYGKISSASLGVITRAIVALEADGGDIFFGETALNILDWLSLGQNGCGMIHILDSSSLISNGRLYSMFLLWMMSELFELLPEVGDLSKPKLVFFFDEAHLLFNGASKVLLEKIEQMVKLIRSKGIGVYFCTQNPRDVPDAVLSQLGTKIQHGLHAYTPTDQKAVRAAASSFRENPEFDTYDAILNLGTGEAVVSFLDEDGIPGMAQKVSILPPKSSFGTITDAERDRCTKESMLYSKYSTASDPDSAYEFLMRKGEEEAAAKLKSEQEAAAAKQAEKEAKEAAKQAEKDAREAAKQAEKEAKAKQKVVKSVGNSVVGTVGREVGKNLGSKFGSFGKTLGGNLGASLGRGIFSTFFRK